MHRRTLIALAAIISAVLAAAPAAVAQTEPFTATYAGHATGPNGNPPCPDGAFQCGTGTATTGLGVFSTELAFDDSCGCLVRTLTFSDGSTLLLDEDVVSFTGPGGSASSHAPRWSEGHPGTFGFSWTVAGGTGSFAAATGSGTDALTEAGLQGTGSLSGTLATP
jgi:hypothetical protein